MIFLVDRVYEYDYLRGLLVSLLEKKKGQKLKTDDQILNLCLLSLILDFGLFDQYASLLNLGRLQSIAQGLGIRALQVEISNLINEHDKKNKDSVQRLKIEELIYEVSNKFMINKDFNTQSKEFEVINQMNSDPVYAKYFVLCKIYISLCQINKSVELDYYKIRCNENYHIIIPANFSRQTCDYLDRITAKYNFYESDGKIWHDELQIFDIRESQPEIDLFKIRFDSSSEIQSAVKYIEISNVFRSYNNSYLVFVADNTLIIEFPQGKSTLDLNLFVIIIISSPHTINSLPFGSSIQMISPE